MQRIGHSRSHNKLLMTKEPARRDSGADGWMLGAAGAGGWSCAGRVRTVSKLKVRAGIILGPHAARTLSKLDLGMRTGTEAQSNAEEGGRAHQPHHRMALASSKADELGSRHSGLGDEPKHAKALYADLTDFVCFYIGV